MARVSIVGMDPSLNNWGIAVGIYDTDNETIEINELHLVKPVYQQGKQVRQNTKDLERAKFLCEHVYPYIAKADLVFVEVPHGSQSARAMASYGVCVGVLGSLKTSSVPFVEVTANEVKLATTGKSSATKAEIIDRAVNNFPNAPWPMKKVKGNSSVITAKAEHMADAIGAIEAGIKTNYFKTAISLIKRNDLR